MFKLWTASLAILAFFILSFTSISAVWASGQTLLKDDELKTLGFSGYESINPDSLIYPLKRLGEKIKSFFIFKSEGKLNYSIDLLNNRFNELVYVTNYQKSGFLTEVINRYNTSIGQLKLENVRAQNQTIEHLKILEILRDRHPANSAVWLNLQQAIDTTRSIL